MRPSIQMPINPMNDSVSLSRATRFGLALGVSLLGLLMPSLEAKADVGRALIPLLVGADAHSQQFREAIQRIDDGDVVEGLRRLQGLNEEIWGLNPLMESYRGDSWLQTVPISDRIGDYLRALSEDHQKIYIAEFQTRARSILDRALKDRDPRKLFKVARLYPLMDFCRETLIRSGELFFEKDESAAALKAWELAADPELGEVSTELRTALNRWMALAAIRCGQNARANSLAKYLDDDASLPASTADQARSEVEAGPLPFEEGRIVWKTSAYSRHVYTESRSRMSYMLGSPTSILAPAISEDTLSVATSAKLLRYDLKTGKLISDYNLRPGDATFEESDPQIRLWSLEQGSYALASYVARASRRENYLGYDIQVALPWRGIKCWNTEIDNGRLLWDSAHRSVTDEQLRTTSFNTRPILRDGRVYALGWRKSGYIDVSLWCLNAETGEPIWVQPVVGNQVDLTMFGEPSREPILGSLLLEGDVVYCCSNLGAIAAVRIWDGKVLWVSEYEQIAPRKRNRRYNNRYRSQVWKPNPMILHEGRLFVTPLDSSDLYCLSAKDGGLLTKVSNEEGALGPHMLGIAGNRLILAGDLLTTILANDPGREELWRQNIVRNPSASRPALVDDGILYLNDNDGVLYLQQFRQGRQAKPVASTRRVRRDRNGWGDLLDSGDTESGGRVDVCGDRILITQVERSTCIQGVDKSKEDK